MSAIKISIITVNLNNKIGLEETIKSVITQRNFRDCEFIIVDGGSSDGSIDVIQKYKSKISYWISEPDNGIYCGMNKGVKEAKGDLCIFLNSGDCFYCSNVIESILKLKYYDVDFIAGNYYIDQQLKYSPKKISGRFMFETSLCHQAVFIRTSLLKDTPYREDYKIVSDWIMMYESLILSNAKYLYTNLVICTYDSQGYSSKNWFLLAQERERYLMSRLPSRIYEDYVIMIQSLKLKHIAPKLIDILSKQKLDVWEEKMIIFIMNGLVFFRRIKGRLWKWKP
ncbi:MAG: glycosyltransferase family 2 protein [Prevotella sp.]|nr:glycosyltransferase family 2 protein [Prevotella sp.]